jgi:hypothetical protein
MNRPKRQHFVPRFYLEGFADKDNFVWTYDKQTGQGRPATPENTAVETNFYSFEAPSGEYDDTIENALADIEGKAKWCLPKLLRGERLSGEQRMDFSVFVATLYLRSPAMVNAMALMTGELAQVASEIAHSSDEPFERIFDAIDAELGNTSTPQDRERMKAIFSKKSNFVMNVDKRIGLRTLASAEQIAQLFYNMSWLIIEPRDTLLITSDNPVVRVCPPEDSRSPYGDGGFLNKRVFVTLPLLPRRMLEMCWNGGDREGILSVPKDRGKPYNRQRAGFSERYLYSSRQDAGIGALAAKHRAPGLRVDIGHPSERFPIELKRKLRGAN